MQGQRTSARSERPTRTFSLLLLNGGVGARVGGTQPKQLITVNGLPILVYSLVAAHKIDAISEIVLNYPEGWLDPIQQIVHDYAIEKPVVYVPAGATRQESVRRMLAASSEERVIVHESARPLVTPADFEEIIAADAENVSFMAAIPFTVAPVEPADRRVVGTLDRSRLRNVQLPQKFSKAALAEAHAAAESGDLTFTEDATLCATAGLDVRFIDGSDRNLKVTTVTDVSLATFLLSAGAGNE
jgi:2-C-methyl-D-erythritol 4-phosphate cytidylyltransferase